MNSPSIANDFILSSISIVRKLSADKFTEFEL
jgi:hypothetical protein